MNRERDMRSRISSFITLHNYEFVCKPINDRSRLDQESRLIELGLSICPQLITTTTIMYVVLDN